MLFEVQGKENIERAKEVMESNNIEYESMDDAYNSWDGVNIYDTLTELFDANPTLDGNDIVDEIYKRVPSMVERLRKIYIEDKSYSNQDSPYLKLEKIIRAYYTEIIEEEIEKMKEEGILIEESTDKKEL